VSEQLHADLKGGAVDGFINKERTRVKLLYGSGTGMWMAGEAARTRSVLVNLIDG
jgi:hypothetical protein